VKDEDTTRPDVRGQRAKRGRRVRLKHKHVAADDRIEWPIELHLGWIAPEEGYVGKTGRGCSLGRRRDRIRGAVHPDDLARFADELGRQERNVPGTGADVQYSHPGSDAAVAEEAAGDRSD